MDKETKRISDDELTNVNGGFILFSHTDPELEKQKLEQKMENIPTEAYKNPQGYMDKGLIIRA